MNNFVMINHFINCYAEENSKFKPNLAAHYLSMCSSANFCKLAIYLSTDNKVLQDINIGNQCNLYKLSCFTDEYKKIEEFNPAKAAKYLLEASEINFKNFRSYIKNNIESIKIIYRDEVTQKITKTENVPQANIKDSVNEQPKPANLNNQPNQPKIVTANEPNKKPLIINQDKPVSKSHQIMNIKAEGLASRCEICHQVDQFNPTNNFCNRCNKPITNNKKDTTEKALDTNMAILVWLILILLGVGELSVFSKNSRFRDLGDFCIMIVFYTFVIFVIGIILKIFIFFIKWMLRKNN